MAIRYDQSTNESTSWIVAEGDYDPNWRAKMESILALGNGYMGVRSATEEHYPGETRGLYVAGVFDAFPGEVTELANLPDWLSMEISLEGERFSCSSGTMHSYERELDLKTGILRRSIDWESPGGKRARLYFERVISMADLHVGAIRVTISPLNFGGAVGITSSIDGQVTNSGVQHLREGELRLLPDGIVASTTETQESGIGVCVAVIHRYELDGEPSPVSERVKTGRRRIGLKSTVSVEQGKSLSITKYGVVHTARDWDLPEGTEGASLLDAALETLGRCAAEGYGSLTARHRVQWAAYWSEMGVEISGPKFDQLALRFALFHLIQMTPMHDPSVSIGAKGLTGEGYKGHVFWDTEIFILPFFTFTIPPAAARLLEYRYRTLEGARKKARGSDYRGAMYPWEGTDTGEETTPSSWSVDIVTGRPIPIWSGRIEQHISVDIPHAVWLYYRVTGDRRFMVSMGLEIMAETARFWASRLEWNEREQRYEIRDIMGPDEYGEHVNNNAYTNYMVRWHLSGTAELYDELAADDPEAVETMARRIDLTEAERRDWVEKAAKIFTNIDTDSGFIRQYDGFIEKKPIDLAKYRGRVGAITEDYGWEELTQMQIVKQADAVMLLYLRAGDFTVEARRVNWTFYEPKTLHDSSLSPAMHSIVASDVDDKEKAYEYFLRAARIDIGDSAAGSDAGVHAAALGGVWQAAVNGFGGVRLADTGVLRISPRLPAPWTGMTFPLIWRGHRLLVEITRNRIAVRAEDEPGGPFEIESHGTLYTHPGTGTLEIVYR